MLVGDGAPQEPFDNTGFKRGERLMGHRIQAFPFKLHLRGRNEEAFCTLDVVANIRLDQAPKNIELLNFFVNQNKEDGDYIYSLQWDQETPDCGVWHAMLGRARLNGIERESLTNTRLVIKMPDEENNLWGGVGTIGMRVTRDRDGFLSIYLLLGTSKDQIVRNDDTIIGYVEDSAAVVGFFNMIDTPAKRARYGANHVAVVATLEFM